MTQPLGQGASTWARTTQFADLEWRMPRKKVIALFAAAKVYPGHEGRNPRTGEPVSIREAVALPSEPPPIAGLHVFATVTFDKDDHLDSITLKSQYPRPAEATDAQLLLAANKVAAALGIEALTALPAKPTTFKHKSTQVVFERDDECFWFELTPT